MISYNWKDGMIKWVNNNITTRDRKSLYGTGSWLLAAQLRTWPRANLVSKSRHIRTLPIGSSWSSHTMEVDNRQTNISERGIFQSTYQTCLVNLHSPNIPNCDALHKRESIRIILVIWMPSYITCNLDSLPCFLHIHMSYCDVLDKPSPATVGLDVDAYSHVEEVNVFSKHILHPTRGFTANCNSGEWRWSG